VEELVQLLELDWMEITSMSDGKPFELELIEITSIVCAVMVKSSFEVSNY
jgi:hypothetical protein